MSGEGGYDRYESNRSAYERLQQKAGESIYYLYYCAGLPDLAATKEIIRAQERGGCDVIELGRAVFPIRWRTDRSSRTHRTVQSAAG